MLAWVVLQKESGEVLLGRRCGSAYGHGLWGLPGGTVEDGEALAQAAAREVWEEVGVTVLDLELLGVRRYQVDDVRGVDFFFLARQWEGEVQPLHKTSEVGWCSPSALPAEVLPWIPALLQSFLAEGALVAEQLGSPEIVTCTHGLRP